MAVLASGCWSLFRESTRLLGEPAGTVFGTAPHLPLGVVIAHVALLAGVGIQGLFLGECMAGMTLVAGIVLVAITQFMEPLFLFFTLDTHVVTAATAPASIHKFKGLYVGYRQGIHGLPAQVVFAFDELLELFFVALGAYMLIGEFGFLEVFGALVVAAVTIGADDTLLVMPAGFPISHKAWGLSGVALDTYLFSSHG